MPSYIALLRKDPDSDYGVEFPDFPGCVTAGTDLDEARAFAEEALSLHIEGLVEDGTPVPSPSRLDEIMADPQHRDAVALLVTVPEAPNPVRVDVTLSEDTVHRIDAAAGSRGLTRSAFLAQAALDALKKAS